MSNSQLHKRGFMNSDGRIFIALDKISLRRAIELLRKVHDSPYKKMIAGYKIHSLLDNARENVIDKLLDAGSPTVWVDYKLHDTPNTVYERVRSLKADYITIHIKGGIEMMRAAMRPDSSKIIGVTELTSLTEKEVKSTSGKKRKTSVLALARLAHKAGLKYITCSPHEVGLLSAHREVELSGMKFITPGIRMAGEKEIDNNQKQVGTPEAAFRAGADFIVLGSALTKARDPIAVLAKIKKKMESLNFAT